MKIIQVVSSAINAVGYDPDTQKMKVEFHKGDIYDFCGVPESVYRSFINSSSVGGYYNDFIKDRYRC